MGRAAMLAGLVLAACAPPAAADWEQPVGGPSPINRSATRAAYSPSLVAHQGIPYVAWEEFDGANSEIRVSRLDHAARAWGQVPDVRTPVNHNPNRDGKDPSLVEIGGVLHVAWSEYDGVNWEVRVSRLDDATGTWAETGAGASPINAAPDRDGVTPRLAAVEGVPFVAWTEWDGTNYEVRVASLGGSGWTEVAGSASPINHSAAHDASYVSLAAEGDEPYVAWQEWDGRNYEIHVAEWEPGHDEWEPVVDGDSTVNHDATRSGIRPSLIAIDDVWHVAWSETDGRNFELRVARLNPSGTAWDEIVGGESPLNHSRTLDAFRPSLTVIGGAPTVAWTESTGDYHSPTGDRTGYEVHVARLNTPGSAWEHIVRADSPINDAPGRIGSEPSLADVGGVPYVAWREFDGAHSQIRVGRLEPEFLDASEIAGQSDALLLQRVRTYGVAYPITLALGSGRQIALRTAADAYEDVVSTTFDGLRPGTGYLWRAFGWDGAARTGAGPVRDFSTATAAAPAPAAAAPPSAAAPPPAAADRPLRLAPMRRRFSGRAGRPVTLRYQTDRAAQVVERLPRPPARGADPRDGSCRAGPRPSGAGHQGAAQALHVRSPRPRSARHHSSTTSVLVVVARSEDPGQRDQALTPPTRRRPRARRPTSGPRLGGAVPGLLGDLGPAPASAPPCRRPSAGLARARARPRSCRTSPARRPSPSPRPRA